MSDWLQRPKLRTWNLGGWRYEAGRGLAIIIFLVTAILIAISILHPNQSAEALADAGTTGLLRPSATPQAAVENLAREIGQRHWASAYSKLANKGEFEESDFVRDLNGDVHESALLCNLGSF